MIMASIDIPLYFLAVAILLLSIYAYPRLHPFLKDIPVVSAWLPLSEDKTPTSKVSHDTGLEIKTALVEKEPEFSASWWTDPQLYELEKRAIFSKVTNITSPIKPTIHPPSPPPPPPPLLPHLTPP